MKERAYLAGGWNEYNDNWKDKVKENKTYIYHDPELDSNQESPDTYFKDDVEAIKNADTFIGYASNIPSEAMFAEAGMFYASHVEKLGDFCEKLIIVWPEDRQPDWALPFLKKMGRVVNKLEDI